LLNTPFDELLATRGVGKKKISSLVKLLARAVASKPDDSLPPGEDEVAVALRESAESNGSAQFDPATVSEAMWSKWRETVRRHQLGDEYLGRLTPSLQDLPTVIWQTPLRQYLDLDLAEIRQLKTHGEKRVRVVLEVFSRVHDALANFKVNDSYDVVLAPKFIRPIEHWVNQYLAREELPSVKTLRGGLTIPLLAQLDNDAGSTVTELARQRIGVADAPMSVRQQAKEMGVTRARVYQLLDECGRVMSVRWPAGGWLLASFREKMHSGGAGPDALQMIDSLVDLFYPGQSDAARAVDGIPPADGVTPIAAP
jgi:hypothetical protein